jgi:hypothetical protein
MKAAFQGRLIPNGLRRDFRGSVVAISHQLRFGSQ